MPGTVYFHTDSGNLELVAAQGEARHYPQHAHMDHRTLGFVHSGSARLEVAGGPCRMVTAGEGFFLRRGEPHSLVVFPDTRLYVLCLGDCPPEQPAAFVASVARSAFGPLPGLEGCFAAAGRRMPAEGAATGFFAGGSGVPPRLERAVREAAALLAAAPERAWPVERLAGEARYSLWHFLRGFRAVTGMTPHHFQQMCRLRLLRALLRADAALAEAAASAGFTDQSHMHKVFKRHHGLTPQAFKQAGFRVPF